MIRKNKIRIAAAALAISLTATVPAADAAKKDKLTIQAEAGGFHGKVKSKKAFCLNERSVTVYNAATGEAVLNDTTGPDGSWDTGNPGIRTGSYFAKATAKPGCKALTSKTVQAQP